MPQGCKLGLGFSLLHPGQHPCRTARSRGGSGVEEGTAFWMLPSLCPYSFIRVRINGFIRC